MLGSNDAGVSPPVISFFNSSSEKKVSILLFKRRTTENPSFNSTSSKNENYPSLGPATKD